MGESLKIEVRNTRAALAPASAEAEAWLERHDASPRTSYLALLAIEEVVTNCIDYGYDDAAEHLIAIEMKIADGLLTMVFVDDGHEFNPLAVAAPNLGVELEQRPVGGLGIHMLRQMSDGMEYERRGGTNKLTLTNAVSSRTARD